MHIHRPATLQDLDAVYAIYMHDEVIPYLGIDPVSLSEFLVVLERLVTSGGFYVVEDAAQIIGFYKISRHEGRARHGAYIGTFAVAPAHRGSGLAVQILNQVIANLQAAGVLRIELMLEADNPRAFRFYSKLGFVQEGLLKSAYKRASDTHYTDEILMAKYLPQPNIAAS